jgi:hypothetical protein
MKEGIALNGHFLELLSTMTFLHKESVFKMRSRVYGIDYRCEDGRFLVSASCVTISNPDSLSSSETGVNPGIRS